jgi:integration host factor subunit beta
MFLSKLSLVSSRVAHRSCVCRTVPTVSATWCIPNHWSTTTSTTTRPSAGGTATFVTKATETTHEESSATSTTLTRRTLIDEVATTHELTKSAAERIVTTVLDSIVDAVKDERRVELSKFGSFDSYTSKATIKRNPRTGAKVDIPAKKRIRFKAYDLFQRTVSKESSTSTSSDD